MLLKIDHEYGPRTIVVDHIEAAVNEEHIGCRINMVSGDTYEISLEQYEKLIAWWKANASFL